MTFVQQIVGVFVRALLVWLAAWLVAHGGPKLTDNQIADLAIAITPALVALVWSLGSKYIGRQRLLNALATPSVMTEAENQIATKVGTPPSVLTDKHEVPLVH
jgi:hypothetical protein